MALGRVTRSIAANAPGSLTGRVALTSIEQCTGLTCPAVHAIRNDGNVVVRTRATSIATPAA